MLRRIIQRKFLPRKLLVIRRLVSNKVTCPNCQFNFDFDVPKNNVLNDSMNDNPKHEKYLNFDEIVNLFRIENLKVCIRHPNNVFAIVIIPDKYYLVFTKNWKHIENK